MRSLDCRNAADVLGEDERREADEDRPAEEVAEELDADEAEVSGYRGWRRSR